MNMELHQRKDARRVDLDDKMRDPPLEAPFNQGQSEFSGDGTCRTPAPWMARVDAMVRHLPNMGSNGRVPHTQFWKDVGQHMWARCG